MDSPRRPDPEDLLRQLSGVDWRAVGLRRTPQREVVLALIRSSFDHPTAEGIHQKARSYVPDISLATVYRTLRLLKEKGLIQEFSGGASPSRFDGSVHEHEHVRCVCCGSVEDVELPEVAGIRERVAERTGFRVGRFPLLFHGICRECALEGPASQNGHATANGEDPDHPQIEGCW